MLDFTSYELAQARGQRDDDYRERRERFEPRVFEREKEVNARTKHGLTEEQCGWLADAVHALRNCRKQLTAFLPRDQYERDPLDRVIQAAEKLSAENPIESEVSHAK